VKEILFFLSLLISPFSIADQYCSYGGDCSGNKFQCVDRGDSVKVCMGLGQGSVNEFCGSYMHCKNDLSCKDRGDGANVCMTRGYGRSGDYCNSDYTCSRGFVCKKRGDGVGICISL